MRRRDFLIGSVATAGAVAYGRAQDFPLMAKLDRISVMSGCFGTLLAETRDYSQPTPPKELDIMDFPHMLAERYNLHNVEVQQFHFLSTDPAYFEKFHGQLKKAKSRMVDMPLELDTSGFDGKISPCSSDPQIRAHAMKLTKEWIDRAAMLECPSVMINQGRAFGDNLTPIIDALKELHEYGAPKNVGVIVEERGPIPIETLVKVIKESGINANPDMGNFKDAEATEKGLRLMYPLALTVSHVKWNPEKYEFKKVVQLSKEMNFKGVYSIETGRGPEPYERVQRYVDLLVENL